MKLRWTERARNDLFSIGRFIGADDAGAAVRWLTRLRERARWASRHPRAGRVVPELAREDVREALLGNYRIVYQTRPGGIDILTVFEGHRLFPAEVISDEDA